jgi:hypothetical protein
MEFVWEVCEAGSHDFFIDLDESNEAGFDGIIRVKTASRNSNPTPGLLTNYLSSATGVISSEAGLEFRNNIVCKFLVGPPIIEMYGQQKTYNDDDVFVAEPVIQPFWGFNDQNFNILRTTALNSVFGNDHVIPVPCKHLGFAELGETYYLSIEEMRCAYESKDSWEDFLTEKNNEQRIAGVVIPQGYPSTSPYVYPHQAKWSAISNTVYDYEIDQTINGPIVVEVGDLSLNRTVYKFMTQGKDNDEVERVTKIFNFVRSYADQYYGSKFTLRLPQIKVTREPESLVFRTSKIPTDAGFFLPAQWSGAIQQNKLPHDYTRLMTDDGRFYPYVRFDNIHALDLNEVPQSEMVFNSGRTSIFVKAGIEEGVAFDNVATSGGPCAVFTLPGPVRKLGETNFDKVTDDRFRRLANSGFISSGNYLALRHQFGVDTQWNGVIAPAVMPDYVCIPLQDNENRYGPWWNNRADGRVEYEVDESLAPWNYGGYDLLDRVAFAKVSQMDSSMCEAETGSMEIAGAPTIRMGAQLVNGGPYITDISVSVGQDGVKTTYQFYTWTPRLMKMGRNQIERVDRLSKFARDLGNRKRTLTDKFVNRTLTALDRDKSVEAFVTKKLVKDKAHGGHTSHGIFSGDCAIAYGSGGIRPSSIRPNCWVQPFYNFTAQLDEDYYNGKAAVSVDGLFRPFSTKPHGSGYGLPSFVIPTTSGEPNVNDLNPYKGNHDINVVIRGRSYPSNLSTILDSDYVNETDYRAMALRGPLVVAGWGFDTEGYPVPNESGYPYNPSGTKTSNFYPNYRQRQDLWPAGPVDMRWNQERGVWEAGGGSKSKIVRIIHKSGTNFPVSFGKTYWAEEMGVDFSDGVGNNVRCSGVGRYMYVGNFRQNVVLESSVYVAMQIGGKYYLDNQSVFNFLE